MRQRVEKRSRHGRSHPTLQWPLGVLGVLCIGVVSAGCSPLERTGRDDPRVPVGEHDVVRVSRYGDASAGYRCNEAVLVCSGGGGGITQQCSCSSTGLIVVQ